MLSVSSLQKPRADGLDGVLLAGAGKHVTSANFEGRRQPAKSRPGNAKQFAVNHPFYYRS